LAASITATGSPAVNAGPGVQHLLLDLGHDRGEDGRLAVEVGVERPVRDARLLGDVGDAGADVAVPLEDPPRRADQRRAVPFRVSPPRPFRHPHR
jgi:hypothetical protein